MFFWNWTTWLFLQFAHKNNSQDFKHQYKKALLFKLFVLKVREQASEGKNCLRNKNELLEASQSWKTSIFILLVFFFSGNPSTCICYAYEGICAVLLQQKPKFMCLSIEIEMRPLFAFAIICALAK